MARAAVRAFIPCRRQTVSLTALEAVTGAESAGSHRLVGNITPAVQADFDAQPGEPNREGHGPLFPYQLWL